jgi:hypothetical protein
MHPVHHTTVEPEDDRMRQIHFLNQPNVIHHPPNCWPLKLIIEPIDGVDLLDRCQLHFSDRKCTTQLDQSVDVPRVEAVFAGPEVILLSHLRSIARRPIEVPQ